jgi:hypothetical protein
VDLAAQRQEGNRLSLLSLQEGLPGDQKGLGLAVKEADIPVAQILTGQEQEIGGGLIQAASKGSNHEDRFVPFPHRQIEGEFQVGLVFVSGINQGPDPSCFQPPLFTRGERIEVSDEDMGVEAKPTQMADAAVGGDQKVSRKKFPTNCFRVSHLSVGKNHGSGSRHNKTTPAGEGGRVLCVSCSLRRHDPDQVMRVEGFLPSSQPETRAPRNVL